MPAWPTSLTFQYPLLQGYQETMPDAVIDSQPDTGPSKSRRRFTAAVRPIAFTVKLKDYAEKTVFENFVLTDLGGRALPFNWPQLSAITGGGTGSFKMTKAPKYTLQGAQRWIVFIELIRLP